MFLQSIKQIINTAIEDAFDSFIIAKISYLLLQLSAYIQKLFLTIDYA